jgi:hypothetical protein
MKPLTMAVVGRLELMHIDWFAVSLIGVLKSIVIGEALAGKVRTPITVATVTPSQIPPGAPLPPATVVNETVVAEDPGLRIMSVT